MIHDNGQHYQCYYANAFSSYILMAKGQQNSMVILWSKPLQVACCIWSKHDNQSHVICIKLFNQKMAEKFNL